MREFWAKVPGGAYHRVTRAGAFLRPACYPFSQHVKPDPAKVSPASLLAGAIESGLVDTCERCNRGD